jgi:predicted ATP-grasp superfamily ATP-dependent carboligase
MRFVAKNFVELAALSPIAPTPNLDLFDQVVDKWSLTRFMIDHQIPIPETILLKGVDEIEDQISALTTPLILKLSRGSAGQDIFDFDDSADVVKFLQSKEGSKGRYLVQSYVEGHDIRCGVLCRNGSIQAYTIHEGVLERARKFGPPAGIRFIESKQVLEVVEELVSKLNWTGIASIDLRYDLQ